MTNQQTQFDTAFLREARIGLSVVAVLLCIFLLVAFGKYSGWMRRTPAIFAAIVDENTGVETLQPFSPFASVNTENVHPKASSAVSTGNIASVKPPVDFQSQRIQSNSQLVPSATGAATVASSNFVPRIASRTSHEPDSRQRAENTFTINRSMSIHPVSPQPPRPASDGSVDSNFAIDAPYKSGISPVPPPSMHAIYDKSVQAIGPDIPNRDRSIRSELPAVTSSTRTSGLSALPSLRQSTEVANNSQGELSPESVEPVIFNQPESNANELNSSDRAIPSDVELTDFQVEQPQAHVSEQATSINSQDGDSFWLIAQRVYGDGRYFNALYECNRSAVESFNDLTVGTRISTPPVTELQTKWPQLCPHDSAIAATNRDTISSYTSKDGDTLFNIARDQLGQASRYLEILQLNTDKLPQDIGHATRFPAGVQLTLPVQR